MKQARGRTEMKARSPDSQPQEAKTSPEVASPRESCCLLAWVQLAHFPRLSVTLSVIVSRVSRAPLLPPHCLSGLVKPGCSRTERWRRLLMRRLLGLSFVTYHDWVGILLFYGVSWGERLTEDGK